MTSRYKHILESCFSLDSNFQNLTFAVPIRVVVPVDLDTKVSFCVTSVMAPLSPWEKGLNRWTSWHRTLSMWPSVEIFCSHSWLLFMMGRDWRLCKVQILHLPKVFQCGMFLDKIWGIFANNRDLFSIAGACYRDRSNFSYRNRELRQHLWTLSLQGKPLVCVSRSAVVSLFYARN